MRDLVGRTLGRYRVVKQIGAGGMGVVYRAHDEQSDRAVAIKVLPEEVSRDPDRVARFRREAKGSPSSITRTSSRSMTSAPTTA